MPQMGDRVRTLVEVQSAGSEGHIVEIYKEPEGYAVDLAIPRPDLVGEKTWENVVLTPDQFVVLPKDHGQPNSTGSDPAGDP
jgi:hypothetical protein